MVINTQRWNSHIKNLQEQIDTGPWKGHSVILKEVLKSWDY